METILLAHIQNALVKRKIPMTAYATPADMGCDAEIGFKDESGKESPISIQIGYDYCIVNKYGFDQAGDLVDVTMLREYPMHQVLRLPKTWGLVIAERLLAETE